MPLFAPEGVYPPAGIFSAAHLIALAVSLVLVAMAFRLTRRLTERGLRRFTLGVAVAVTALEVIKIVYKFAVCRIRFSDLNNWLPLYFCSLFIYYTWCSAIGGTRLTPYGDAFIGAGALLGGAAFLIYPTTSITMVPIWHFLSLHSMLFHSLMVLCGLCYLRAGLFRPSPRSFLRYAAAFGVFAVPAVIINAVGAGRYNAMILRDPYRLPRPLAAVAAVSPALYTLVAAAAYLLLPYGVAWGVRALCFRRTDKAGEENGRESTPA